ncbi:aldose 1-epimerase family protein [Pedobacter sp.]|uniref:aldose 1-epimerase family protein n=1 Tax=Pedobacter sp. TaxID=1411316 RepID=UPI003D7F4E56
MILLENEYLKASFVSLGAELKQLIHKETGIDYMWNSDPAYWAKSSPVLFPIVGALDNNSYNYEGKDYTLPRHGFAREMDFEVTQVNNNTVLFTLVNTDETLKNYPFEFQLGLRYVLEATTLSCTYEVYNPGKKDLLFSIGAHPAFKVPLAKDEAYSDYELVFNKDTELVYHKIANNLIDSATVVLPLNDGALTLNHELFYEDALVFKTLKSDQITLQDMQGKHGLHFKFEGFPYFGIWAAKDADFVCLEPWCGIADHVGHHGKLEQKEGVNLLKAGESWNRTWQVACF